MPITLLPTPPSRQDPANFNTRADAFLGALPTFGTEANTLATDVNTKQTQAATSATNAATSATNAANSASAAATSATNASSSASSASTSATSAANSATLAVANSVLNKFTFSTTTTMSDPGIGLVRFNNTTLSSVTAVALDAQTADSGNPNILNVLLTHDDSTSAVKGYLKFTKAGTPSTFVVFTISALVNNTAWVQYTVSHVASSGTFSNNDAVVMEFSRTGDAGTGDVTTTGTQTLTNKTLDFNSNTFLNFPTGGSIFRSSRTSNTIIGTADKGALIDITSGTFTQTFAAAATLGNGWWCYIRNSGTGDITLDPNASEQIDGLTSYIMYPGEVRMVQCDGTALRSVVLNSFYKVFTASGNFIKPPGYAAFEGIAWDGGQSGGMSSAGAPRTGGLGSKSKCFFLTKEEIGISTSVVVGSGGSSVAGNGTFEGNPGGKTTIDGFSGFISTWDGVNPYKAGDGGNSNYDGASALPGGISPYAGDGGKGTYGPASGSMLSGEPGTAPGGGGGASSNNGWLTLSGAGARGELRIWGLI